MPTDAGGGHGQRDDSQGRAQMVADRAGFHFPRKPKPDVNIHPDSRLAQPKQPEAWKGPHPFLQGHGFNGDIQSFNRRVQVAHDGYANAYKQEPSPGLLWDVAMSPGVEDGQIPDLFKIPLSQRDTKAQQWHLEAQHNGDSLHVRDDGKVQPTNLQTAFRAKLGFNHPDLQPANPKSHVLSVQEFHKRYPLIMDGFTGMLPFGKNFWSDVAQSQGNPARYKQQIGFLTPNQAIAVANQAESAQTAQAMQAAATIDPTSTFNPDNPQASEKTHEGQVAANAKAGLTQAFGKAHSDAISRNKQRQEWLLKHDPNGLFSGLQANGQFDREWMVKYDQWSRTPGAAFLAMQQIAKQNYFDPSPSGIKDMERAQQLKTKLANDSKKWSEKFQIEATPLRFFSHGYFSLDHPLINNDGTPNTKEIHNLLTDFWKYEDTGTSWLWPVAALQGGFRFAKLGFDTLSGGFNQITADANGLTTLAGKGIPAIFEGKSTKQIADMFATAVKQNPDWIRVLGFGYLPKNLRGNAAFLDGVGNFIVSSAIAMTMKGPGYWKVGEDVPLTKLQGNLAVKLMTRLAHSNIKAGDLWRAEQVLGPGDSEKFIVALEKDIKSGKLGHEDFHNLVTRYVKDGKVEYPTGTTTRDVVGHKAVYPEGTLFHGSPEGEITNVDPLYHTKMWQEGQGFYLTSDAEKAAKYAEGKTASPERRAGSGAVNAFRLKPGANVLNIDSQPESFFRGIAEQILREKIPEQTWKEWARDIPSGKYSEGVTNRMRLIHLLTGWGDWPKTDAYYEIEEVLRERGIQATLHHENGVPVWVVKDSGALEPVRESSRIPIHGPERPVVKEFDQGILPQLHTDKIPKSLTKLTLQQLGPQIRKGLNNLELQALSVGNKFGSVSEASLRTLRNLFGLANPAGKSMHLFRPDMPARLESFIVNKGLASHDEATQIVNQFIRARARENLPQMQKVLKGVSKAFRDKFPDTNFAAAPEFERMLETENLTYFRFPSRPLGNFKDAPGRAFMDAMNKIGSYWRSQILATGPGLFYKHLTRDTAAALMGGMRLRQSAEMVKAWDVAQGIMRDNPELFRQYSVSRKTLAGAETKYMLRNDGFAEGRTDTWNLQEAIQQSPHLRQEFADRAAGHMHRLLTSKAYSAFQETVKSGDMGPLVDVILRDKQFRHLLNRERGVAKKVQEQVRANFPAPGHSEVEFHENVALRNMLKRNIVHKEATEYAKLIFSRYKSVLDEGKSHGLGNVFDDVEKMMFAKPGTSDKEIAKYLLDHDLNIRVTGGTPVAMNKWDKTTGQLIRAYMSPNRFNRGRMFEHVFQQNYSNMLKMGYDPKEAFSSAVHISEHQTMYHMLDFSNMLEFEQRFRGFLPFFTKHRLFTKWLVARVAQYPYMAVPVSQIGKHLDSYGRLNFNFHGVPLNLSLSRLFWLNSQDLPVTVPGAEFVPYLNRTGLTPELTRFDSLIGAWIHGVGSGWNYKSVTAHMNPYDVRRLDKYMAVYAIHYRMNHGENAPVSESEALKYAMIRGGFFGGMTRDLIVNGAYLSPVTFSSPQTPGPIKKLDDQFSKLMNENPAKARAFLDQHPEAGLGWGMTQNFDLYNHVTQYWGLYDQIHSKYLKVEQRFSQQVLAGKPMTAEDYAKVRKAQQEYDQGIQHLLVQDARNWTQDAGGYKAGSVDQSGLISNYGPWGTLFLHDPIGSVNKLIAQFGGRKAFSSADLHKIYGYDTQGLQYAIDHYKELGLDTQARGDMIQKLNRIEGVYHVTGTPTLYSAYSQARSKFESKLIGLYDKAKNESGYAKAVTEYQARQLILSNYENPTLRYGGKEVKVLPFSEFGLATKTPQELSLQIWKNMVGFSYSSLTFDQKQLLGIKTTPQVDEGWGVFNSWVADYQQQYGKEASSSVREQLAVAANRQYPGFYRDWKIAHLPKAFVLLYYAKGAFQGQYGNLWQQLAQRAATTYDTNRREWANQVPALDQWIKQNWPKGFVNEYEAAGGATFLQGLISPWG